MFTKGSSGGGGSGESSSGSNRASSFLGIDNCGGGDDKGYSLLGFTLYGFS